MTEANQNHNRARRLISVTLTEEQYRVLNRIAATDSLQTSAVIRQSIASLLRAIRDGDLPVEFIYAAKLRRRKHARSRAAG